MSRILITGASGLLGISCVLAALERGHSVVAAVHQNLFACEGVEVVQKDLTDLDLLTTLEKLVRIDWIINCAAATDVEWCEKNQKAAFRINSEFPRVLAHVAYSFGARLLHISTDAIFEGVGRATEFDPVLPLNVYAETKLAGEKNVLDVFPSSLVVRTNIYGWNLQQKRSLSEWILGELEAGHDIDGFFDLKFNPILANQLAEILFDMMETPSSGIYHVAGSETCTKYDFALRIADLFRLDANLVHKVDSATVANRAPRPKDCSLNTDRICKLLGRPMPSIQDGLHQFRVLRENGFSEKLKSMRR